MIRTVSYVEAVIITIVKDLLSHRYGCWGKTSRADDAHCCVYCVSDEKGTGGGGRGIRGTFRHTYILYIIII